MANNTRNKHETNDSVLPTVAPAGGPIPQELETLIQNYIDAIVEHGGYTQHDAREQLFVYAAEHGNGDELKRKKIIAAIDYRVREYFSR